MFTTKKWCYRARRQRYVKRRSLGIQERADLSRKAITILDVTEVSAVELDITGAGDVVSQELAVGGSGGGVVCSGDDENGGANLGELVAEVEVAHSGAAGGVAVGVGGFESLASVCDGGSLFGAKGGSEPALDGSGGDVLHSFFANSGDASVPHFGGANFGGSAGKDEFVQPLRGVCGEPHADLAAHREAAEVEPFE